MSSQSVRLSARRIWEQKDGVNCCTSCAISTCLEAMRRDYDVLSPIFHYHRSGAPLPAGADGDPSTDVSPLRRLAALS